MRRILPSGSGMAAMITSTWVASEAPRRRPQSSRVSPLIAPASEIERRYLDLVKRALTGLLQADGYEVHPGHFDSDRRVAWVDRVVEAFVRTVGRASGQDLRLARRLTDRARAAGGPWPLTAETMIGLSRLDHLQRCVEDVLTREVPGDLIETGVWRGGATILMRAVLAVYGVSDRTVWGADSFNGVPAPDAERHPADAASRLHTFAGLAVPLEEVRAAFARYGLLDEQVRFLPGRFRDTLATVRNRQWALLRLDGDLYESTMDALENLYPSLSPGGYVIVDDYGAVEGCRQAVEEYRRNHRISEPMEHVDASAVCWRRRPSPR
jgi:O-methyltransferase